MVSKAKLTVRLSEPLLSLAGFTVLIIGADIARFKKTADYDPSKALLFSFS